MQRKGKRAERIWILGSSGEKYPCANGFELRGIDASR